MKMKIDLAIIGGSGLYKMDGGNFIQELQIPTPFGNTSSPIMVSEFEGKNVAFLARHGIGHFINPTEVNYRANIYALKFLGVSKVVSVSACGSLREDYKPGEIVIPDQLFDFTKKRDYSFFGEGLVSHVGVADPFCPTLRHQLINAVKKVGATQHENGALITIEGPRFSTKSESNVFRQWGMSIIGMTASPEAFLAREAEMCYATMAHVTDYDVWHTTEEPVTVEMVVRTLLANTAVAQQSIIELIKTIDDSESCTCQNALANALITDHDAIPMETKERLQILVEKYL